MTRFTMPSLAVVRHCRQAVTAESVLIVGSSNYYWHNASENLGVSSGWEVNSGSSQHWRQREHSSCSSPSPSPHHKSRSWGMQYACYRDRLILVVLFLLRVFSSRVSIFIMFWAVPKHHVLVFLNNLVKTMHKYLDFVTMFHFSKWRSKYARQVTQSWITLSTPFKYMCRSQTCDHCLLLDTPTDSWSYPLGYGCSCRQRALE